MTIRAMTLNHCIVLLAYIPVTTYMLVVGIVLQKIYQIISVNTDWLIAMMEKNQ